MSEIKTWGIEFYSNDTGKVETFDYTGTEEELKEYLLAIKQCGRHNIVQMYQKTFYEFKTTEEYVLADENQVYHYWKNVVADPPQIYVKDSSDKFVAVKFIEYFSRDNVYVTAIVDSNGDALLIYSSQLDPDDKEFYVKKTETKLVEKK